MLLDIHIDFEYWSSPECNMQREFS